MTRTTTKLADYARIQQEKKENGRLIIPTVKEYLLSKWEADQDDRNPHAIHPSEMAKKDWCERATAWRILTGWTPPSKFNFVLQGIFDEGHQIHDKWQGWLRGEGSLWGRWTCCFCLDGFMANASELPAECNTCGRLTRYGYGEVPLRFGILEGHEDAAVGNRLVEFKSIGIGVLRIDNPGLLSRFYIKQAKVYDLDGLWKALDHPLASHTRQANVYLWLAKMMGWDFPKCSIVYEFKPNQQSREYVIPLSMDIMQPMLDKCALIMDAVTTGNLPRCPYRGCKHCEPYDAEPRPTLPDRVSECRERMAAQPWPGIADSRSSRLRHSNGAGRHHGFARPEADEDVRGTDSVAQVHADSASTSGSRRNRLRKKTQEIGKGF